MEKSRHGVFDGVLRCPVVVVQNQRTIADS